MSPSAEHLLFMRDAAQTCLPPYRESFSAQLRELAGLIIQAGCASCPPVGENGSALAVTAPAVPGQRVGTLNEKRAKLSSKPTRSARSKKLSCANFDLFPELLPSVVRSSPMKRQNGLSSHALGALSLRLVTGNGGSSGDDSL